MLQNCNYKLRYNFRIQMGFSFQVVLVIGISNK